MINVIINNRVTGTNSIASGTTGASNSITAYGVPGLNYTLERATNLSPSVWIDINTNAAATNGLINVYDTFWDLGGVPPGSAYYRLKWQRVIREGHVYLYCDPDKDNFVAGGGDGRFLVFDRRGATHLFQFL